MSITKSYNKHTGIYYAYDTTYFWDETAQCKKQKKVCIGQYDPNTGEIVPNAKRGRPTKYEVVTKTKQQIEKNSDINENLKLELMEVVAELNEIKSAINVLDERFGILQERLLSLYSSVSKDELS